MIRQFLLAVQFLTILPLRIRRVDEKDLEGSMAFFPLVGVLLGAIIIAMASFFQPFLPPVLTVLFLLLFWTVLTGGLHLDGLADTLDGFIGGKNREATLSIMRDPAIGTMGTLGIFFVLAFKWGALYTLCENGFDVGANNYSPLHWSILPFVLATGRYLMVLGAFVSRYPHAEGEGKNYIGKIPLTVFLTASITMLFIAGITLQLMGLFLLVTILGGAALWIIYAHKRIGGMTGDTLGALAEVSEAVWLVLICRFL